jgi:Serine-threonine protein kinase 19
MPSYLSGARVKKPDQLPSLRRHTSSPFASAPRVKPTSIQRSKSLADALEDELEKDGAGRLDATGQILTVIDVAAAADVQSAIRYSRNNMFCAIPERAGMNSVRIAEVLNFQKNLPPVVSLAHVHALVSASSRTERQIATLLAGGELRKIKVLGRGNEISGTGELLITTRDLRNLLTSSQVAPDIIATFIDVLQHHPRAASIPSGQLPPAHISALTTAGFLVSASASASRNLSFSGSSIVATASISRAHSGTSAAVGGDSAFEHLGGTGAAKRHGEGKQTLGSGELGLSVPNLGPYLRLLNAGRTHLTGLLGKAKYKEAPLYLLRERWDGAVDNDGSVSTAKKIRGEFSEVMPVKTKKWKKLNGLNFDWTLEECLGAGLIELFETKSVGLGVRAIL